MHGNFGSINPFMPLGYDLVRLYIYGLFVNDGAYIL